MNALLPGCCIDPWAARDQYIDVILDRSPESLNAFFARWGKGALDHVQQQQALELLETQRHALLMYTSCGWFFDELTGLETVQVIQYAGRVVQLAQHLIPDLEERFLCELEKAKSNLPEHGDGRRIYIKWVKPAMINLDTVVAHYAMSEIFEQYPDSASIYCYKVEREAYARIKTGASQLVSGRINITSRITGEYQRFDFASLYFDNHNLTGGVSVASQDDAGENFRAELGQAFERADLAATISIMSGYFKEGLYSLNRLFRDEQRTILGIIMQATNEEAENIYRQFYRHNAPLMRYLSGLNLPLPATLTSAAALTINANLRRALLDDEINLSFVRTLLDEGKALGVKFDGSGLAFQLIGKLSTVGRSFSENPTDPGRLQQFKILAELVRDLPFDVDIWLAQNIYYQVQQSLYLAQCSASQQGDEAAADWLIHFDVLGDYLSMAQQQIQGVR